MSNNKPLTITSYWLCFDGKPMQGFVDPLMESPALQQMCKGEGKKAAEKALERLKATVPLQEVVDAVSVQEFPLLIAKGTVVMKVDDIVLEADPVKEDALLKGFIDPQLDRDGIAVKQTEEMKLKLRQKQESEAEVAGTQDDGDPVDGG